MEERIGDKRDIGKDPTIAIRRKALLTVAQKMTKKLQFVKKCILFTKSFLKV